MAKKIPNTEEQITRQPIRPHVSPEWLTKLSSAEFWSWCDREADIIRFRGGTSREAIQLHLDAEIKNNERLYQMLKEVKANQNGLKKAKKKDIKLGGELTGITANTFNYGNTWNKTYITYDVVSKPSTPNAILRRDKYQRIKDHTKLLFR